MNRFFSAFDAFWFPQEAVDRRAARILLDLDHQLLEARLALAAQEGIVEGLEYRRLVVLSTLKRVDSTPVPGHNVTIVPGH